MRTLTLLSVLTLSSAVARTASAQTYDQAPPPIVITTTTDGQQTTVQYQGGYGQPAPQDPNAYAQPVPQDPNAYAQPVPQDPNAYAQPVPQDPNAYPYQGGYAQPVQDPNAVNGGAYGAPYTDPSQGYYDDGYDPQAYSQFESTLAPYGTWVDSTAYGRVWCPSASVVGAGFQPYGTAGHWMLSEYGWTWVSDWDWGWAPFHYGRWVTLDGAGWAWVPGTTWGPAWVSWRTGGGYVGWAPLPPAGLALPAAMGYGSPWRFVYENQLASARPVYVPGTAVPAAWSQTAPLAAVRAVNVGGVAVRVPAGPVALAPRLGIAASTVPLARLAPALAPRVGIVPRVGVPLATRPWIANRVAAPGYVAPRVGYGAPTTVYRAPAPAYVAPGGAYNAPVYRAPAPAYVAPRPVYNAPVYRAPVYSAPAPVYRAPVYNAPAPVYRAPVYNAPRPVYSAPAPAYRPAAPVYSAPRFSAPVARPAAPAWGGFHGGGGFGRRR